jgi:hypothetical protein
MGILDHFRKVAGGASGKDACCMATLAEDISVKEVAKSTPFVILRAAERSSAESQNPSPYGFCDGAMHRAE